MAATTVPFASPTRLQRQDQGASSGKAWPGTPRMSPQVSSAAPALWVLGSFALLLWLWALCAACHRKQVLRRQAGLQGSVRPAEAVRARCPQPLPRRSHLCTFSTSDTRLHELHRGPRGGRALRPASMDLLHPHWPERSPAAPPAFPHQELPGPLPAAAVPAGPSDPVPSVGLAAVPRASLAAGPVLWAGARLASSCTGPGPGPGPAVPEYACIQKPKGTGRGPHSLHQGKVEGLPAPQVDVLYSRVSKPRRRDPTAATIQLDPTGKGTILALGSGRASEALPVSGPLENVYESIQEMRAPGRPEPPSSGS